MAVQQSRVIETLDEAVTIATEMQKLHARVRKFLAFNTAQSIPYSNPKTATIANATDIWTSTSHGLLVNQKVRLTNSGGALPAGFLPNTDYFVIAGNLAANTLQLSATLGGATVNATGDGTGTHTIQPIPSYVTLETTNDNVQNRHYTLTEGSNAIGSMTQFDRYMTNLSVTQGDHLGTLAQLARANGV